MANKKTADKDISYEQAMERLQKILAAMESGDMTLEESILAYETAVGLIRQCRALLDAADRRIEVLKEQADGEVTVQPMPDAYANKD